MLFDISVVFSLLSSLLSSLVLSSPLSLSAVNCIIFLLFILLTSHSYRKWVSTHSSALISISRPATVCLLLLLWLVIISVTLAQQLSALPSLSMIYAKVQQTTVLISFDWKNWIFSVGMINLCFLESRAFPRLRSKPMENIQQRSFLIQYLSSFVLLLTVLVATSGYLAESLRSQARSENLLYFLPKDGKHTNLILMSLKLLVICILILRIPSFPIHSLIRDIMATSDDLYQSLKRNCCNWMNYREQHDYSSYSTPARTTRTNSQGRSSSREIPLATWNSFHEEEKWHENREAHSNINRLIQSHRSSPNCYFPLEETQPLRRMNNESDSVEKRFYQSQLTAEAKSYLTFGNHSTNKDFSLLQSTFNEEIQKTQIPEDFSEVREKYSRFSSSSSSSQASVPLKPNSTAVYFSRLFSVLSSYSSMFFQLLLKILVFLFSCLIASTFQSPIQLLSFFGGFFGMIVSVIFPICFYFKIMKEEDISSLEKFILIVILLFAVVAASSVLLIQLIC
jgi:hypothetical protein